MRSAIFENTRTKGRASPTPISLKKRSATTKAKSVLTWNLDDMIAAYSENKSLPPILSPTLPPMADLNLPAILTPSNSNLGLTPSTSNVEEKKSANVKYIDKTNSSKPRFMIRFTFREKSALKKINSKPSRPTTPVPKSIKPSTPKPSTPKVSTPKVSTPKPSTPNPGVKLRTSTNTPKVSRPSTPITKSSTPKPNTPTFTPVVPSTNHDSSKEEKRDQTTRKDDFIKMKTHWIKLAKECKFMSQSTEGLISLIIEFDSLLLFSLAYHFDDKSKLKIGIPLSDRYWLTLLEDVDKCIERLETFNKPKTYLIGFTELLRTYKIYINKRIIEIYDKSRPLDVISRYEEINTLHTLIETKLPNLNQFIADKFPRTWAHKSSLIDSPGSEPLPLRQGYYLPLGPYLNLNQYTRVFFHIVNEFIEICNKDNDLIYSLKAGLQGP